MIEAVRVGVVGGGVGRVHIRSLQALPEYFKVAAVCDLDSQKARQVAQEFSIPHWTTDVDTLYQRQDLDVLDFCTPPYQHFGQMMNALSAGKHVICEKPLVGSLAEIDQLIEASQRAKKRVMPILQYRFGHGLQKLKRLVDRGVAGQPFLSTVEMAWHRGADYYDIPWRGKWKTELGGTILNHAIHQLDMLCYIVGPVSSVYARTASLVNPIEVEDSASISLQMQNGSLATLSATLGSVKEISRLRFCFRNLTAESNTKPYANSDDPWSFTGDTEAVTRQIVDALAGFNLTKPVFEEQFANFYAAVSSDEELAVGLADARSLLEVMTAIYESARTNRPVDLPIHKENPMYLGWSPASAAAVS